MLWATTPAGTETYRYDGHGRRTSIIRPGGTTTQLYSRDGSFLYERAPNGVITKHIHLGGRQVARQVSSTRTYTHTDTLGSILRRTDTAGAEIERTRYEPYGSTNTAVYLQGPGFTGHVTDAATKLSYMQQRYYDNTAMRFVSVDPVGPSTSDGSNFNRYWYANNNPYKFIDPDGRYGLNTGPISSCNNTGNCMTLAQADEIVSGDAKSITSLVAATALIGGTAGAASELGVIAAGANLAQRTGAAVETASVDAGIKVQGAINQVTAAVERVAVEILTSPVTAAIAANIDKVDDALSAILNPGPPPGSRVGMAAGAVNEFVKEQIKSK